MSLHHAAGNQCKNVPSDYSQRSMPFQPLHQSNSLGWVHTIHFIVRLLTKVFSKATVAKLTDKSSFGLLHCTNSSCLPLRHVNH